MDRHLAESLDHWLTTPPEDAGPDECPAECAACGPDGCDPACSVCAAEAAAYEAELLAGSGLEADR
jgi:hypothetical protein